MTSAVVPAVDYRHALPEIIDKLLSFSDLYLEGYNEHSAFSYLVSDLFDTTNSELFTFTDGPNDGGVDFIISDSPVFIICQSKCPNYTTLASSSQPATYDNAALEELLHSIEMLTDDSGEYPIKTEIKRFRGDFQRDLSSDPDSTQLIVYLAILGKLTDPARANFEAHRQNFSTRNIRLRLVEWDTLYSKLQALESPAKIDFNIALNCASPGDLLSHNEYCYMLAKAFDFYEAFRKHGWNLFEWNVRSQLRHSSINRKIVSTLSSSKHRKKFHHYNNGLLITCRHFTKNQDSSRVKLIGPQIINGCQTVTAISDAYENLSPSEQEQFRDNTLIQVKIISDTDSSFINELAITTNNQNPMNARNLKSNSVEQRGIQNKFSSLQTKWFYQRKDGEWDSLFNSHAKARWFKKAHYRFEKKKYRKVDNQDLAKAWYAFIGYSGRALMGGHDYFADESGGAYNIVFRSIPSPAFWDAFKEIEFKPNPRYYIAGIPSPHQYLLAFSISRYTEERRISPALNRSMAIERGVKLGDIRKDQESGKILSDRLTQDRYLISDSEYIVNNMINNMNSIFIELYSFILCRKFSDCEPYTCQKLISTFESISNYLERGCTAQEFSIKQDGHQLFGPIYEFLFDSTRQYYFRFTEEIQAAPRRRAYLAQRSTIVQLKQLVISRNEQCAEVDQPWLQSGKTFIDSLPDLPN